METFNLPTYPPPAAIPEKSIISQYKRKQDVPRGDFGSTEETLQNNEKKIKRKKFASENPILQKMISELAGGIDHGVAPKYF